MSDAMRPILDELRSMGVRATLHSMPAGSLWFEMHGTSEWSPEFSRQVAEVLTRHGMREAAEGQWVSEGTSTEESQRMAADQRSADEYRAVAQTLKEHSDWTDEEVAESCGVDVDYVAAMRREFDR